MKKTLYICSFLAIFFYACEDVVQVDLKDGEPVLVVDAWINNLPQTQTVKLTNTQPYFEASFAEGVTGAVVTVTETTSGTVYNFLDADNDGTYTWGGAGETFGTIGESYELKIELNDKVYLSTTQMLPTTAVDSITYEHEENAFGNGGIIAQFYGRDLPGEGNTYWIKTYRNGQFLNKADEINTAYDAAFGSGADELVFIEPIRRGINPVYGATEGNESSEDSYYVAGDEIRVEIHSISEEAYYYFDLIQEQMTLGDQTIFAPPPTNVSTNIVNPADDKEVLQGFFNISAVSSLTITVE